MYDKRGNLRVYQAGQEQIGASSCVRGPSYVEGQRRLKLWALQLPPIDRCIPPAGGQQCWQVCAAQCFLLGTTFSLG